MKNLEINDYELTWYMQEILMHCSGACMGYNRLVNLLGDPKTIQSRLTWFELTSFLSHAAMISKYLSPIARGHVATIRKHQLRKTLNIPEDSEVLPRDARDNIEHFDERIDNWIGGRQSNILEIVIKDREAFVHLRGNEKKNKKIVHFRWYVVYLRE